MPLKRRKKNAWGAFQKKYSGKGFSREQMKNLYRQHKSTKNKFGSKQPLTAIEKDIILRSLQKYNSSRVQRRHGSSYGQRLPTLFEVMGPPLNLYTATPWSV